jgi:hypothetical protein
MEHGEQMRSSRVASAIYADLSQKTVCNFRTLLAHFVIGLNRPKPPEATATI